MSTDDSFIVLEETPSMMQFSLLDASIVDTATIATLENGSNVLSEKSNTFNKDLKVGFSSTSSTKSQSVNYLNSTIEERQRKQTSPKTTLALDFLLGLTSSADLINCDKAKVQYSKCKFLY